MSGQSETSKYRHLTTPYCQGCGIDVASQGDPVVPWAWSLDLPPDRFAYYNSNNPPRGPIQLRGDGHALPVDSGSLDFVYSSHLLEDYPDWNIPLAEWVRVLKPGGHLVILIPDRELWCAACAKGQPPNDFHRHEGHVGELSEHAVKHGIVPIIDRLTEQFEGDYTILFIGRKQFENGHQPA